LKKFEKPIKKSKIENLATLLQLAPLVGFLPTAGKIRRTRENFPSLTSFCLKYWLVLEFLTCLSNFRIYSEKK
jgi:hypothetical protein